jgi:hypothetical protein
MFGDAALSTNIGKFVMVKFIKIDIRHENIGKLHAKGLHQPEGKFLQKNSERAVSPKHYSRNYFRTTAWNKENY